jgi:predicted transport protein
MPIYEQAGVRLTTVRKADFSSERELQRLVESNLPEVFGCRLVATEFSTGEMHGGRIDSLALSENNNPVIIEYKKKENANLINQALFYLDWMRDHHGDFEVAAKKTLGDVEIDWGHIRVICLAPSYDKYSLHAVKQMGAGLELWQYQRFENGVLEMEEIHRSETGTSKSKVVTDQADKVENTTRDKSEYSVEALLGGVDEKTRQLFFDLDEYILSLDPALTAVPLKLYLAYKLARNVVCVKPTKRQRLWVWIDLPYRANMPSFVRDVTEIGHHGTGNLELVIGNEDELTQACALIREAYLNSGGN